MSIQGVQGSVAGQQFGNVSKIQKPESAAQKSPKDEKIQENADKDQFVPGEQEEKPGLYRVVPDEDGAPKIQLDQPARKKPDPGTQGQDGPARKEGTATVNTDRVDQQIRKLKGKKKQLEQQVRAAAGTDREEELRKRLAQIRIELQQKDNDAYRRQNADVSQDNAR